jgi:hypothetical protein
MQTYIFGILTAFFAAHAYRDYLHLKGVKHTFFTRVAHFWDAPQYEKHGMIGSVIVASVFFWFTIT